MIFPWKKKKKKVWPKVLIFLLLFFGSLRISIPYFLKNYLVNEVNKILPHHRFEIGSLELSLLRLSYSLNDVTLKRVNEDSSLMRVGEFQVDINLKSMLAKVNLNHVVLDLIYDEKSFGLFGGTNKNKGWFESIRVVTLGHLEELRLNHSEVHYRGQNLSKDHFFINQLFIHGKNLYQVRKDENFRMDGKLMGNSTLSSWGHLDIQKKNPQLNIKIKIDQFRLIDLGFFFRDHAGLEVKSGEMDIYSEVKMDDGRIKSYIKPFLSNFTGDDVSDKYPNTNKKMNLALRALSSSLSKNDENQSIGVLLPITSDSESFDIDFSMALKSGVKHIMGTPLKKGFE